MCSTSRSPSISAWSMCWCRSWCCRSPPCWPAWIRGLAKSARMLGAGRLRAFWSITLPLSLDGITTGCILTFMISNGSFVTMLLLGGGRVVTLPVLIYQQFTLTHDVAFASAMGNLLLLLALLCLLLQLRLVRRRGVRMRFDFYRAGTGGLRGAVLRLSRSTSGGRGGDLVFQCLLHRLPDHRMVDALVSAHRAVPPIRRQPDHQPGTGIFLGAGRQSRRGAGRHRSFPRAWKTRDDRRRGAALAALDTGGRPGFCPALLPGLARFRHRLPALADRPHRGVHPLHRAHRHRGVSWRVARPGGSRRRARRRWLAPLSP